MVDRIWGSQLSNCPSGGRAPVMALSSVSSESSGTWHRPVIDGVCELFIDIDMSRRGKPEQKVSLHDDELWRLPRRWNPMLALAVECHKMLVVARAILKGLSARGLAGHFGAWWQTRPCEAHAPAQPRSRVGGVSRLHVGDGGHRSSGRYEWCKLYGVCCQG